MCHRIRTGACVYHTIRAKACVCQRIRSKACVCHRIRKLSLHIFYSVEAERLPVIFICIGSCDFKGLNSFFLSLNTQSPSSPAIALEAMQATRIACVICPLIIRITYFKLVSEPSPRSVPAPCEKIQGHLQLVAWSESLLSGLPLFFPSFSWLSLMRDSQDEVEMGITEVFSRVPVRCSE